MNPIILHLLYRIARSVFYSVYDSYYVLIGRNSVLYTLDKIEICRILYRRKIIPGDMSGPNDFVWLHEGFLNSNAFLKDDYWSLYTVDEKFAYFVSMPKPAILYTVDEAPFVYMKQFDDCLKLARCTLDNFVHITRYYLCDRGPVIYESSAARSGSTLMAQLLQASGKAYVLGEPDALTALTNLYDRNRVSQDTVYPVVRAIFRYLLRFQRNGEIYVVKPQSNCIRLVPFIKEVCPNIKHFFTFRKNTKRILISVEKVCRMGCSSETTWLWNHVSPNFACWLVNFGGFEYAFMKRFGPIKDCLDYAIVVHLSPYYEFLKNRDLFDLPWVLYEDLMENPKNTLRTVFELCQIPLDRLDESLKVLNKDSQVGTMLSQESMKNVPTTELTEDKIAKINEICYVLDVPFLEI